MMKTKTEIKKRASQWMDDNNDADQAHGEGFVKGYTEAQDNMMKFKKAYYYIKQNNMSERIEEVKVYLVKYKCSKCKTGFLKHGDPTSDSPGHYHNICVNPECKHAELLTKKYPFTTYIPIPDGTC